MIACRSSQLRFLANVWMRTYRLPVAAALLVVIGTLLLSA